MGSINKCEIIDGQKVLTPFVQTNSIEDYYSTEEEATNKVWIDGKRIYRKCGVYNNTTGNDIVLDSTLTTSYIDNVVSMNCCGIYGNPETKTTIRGFTGNGYRLDLLVTNTGFHKLQGNVSFTTLTWWIEYTKA